MYKVLLMLIESLDRLSTKVQTMTTNQILLTNRLKSICILITEGRKERWESSQYLRLDYSEQSDFI